MSDAKYCKDCKNMKCPEGRVNCKYPDAIACDLYRDTSPTLFQKITSYPGALAVELVTLGCDGWWAYVGFGKRKTYPTREEAIAATEEALKEVCS